MTLTIDEESQNTIETIYGIEVINALKAYLEKSNIMANLKFTRAGDYALAQVSTKHNIVLAEIGKVAEILHSFKAIDFKPKLAIWLKIHHQNDERPEIIECLYKAWQNEKNMFFGTTDILKELKILELL